jgi:hypothetical protein
MTTEPPLTRGNWVKMKVKVKDLYATGDATKYDRLVNFLSACSFTLLRILCRLCTVCFGNYA